MGAKPRVRINNVQFFSEHPIYRYGKKYLPSAEGIVIYEVEMPGGEIFHFEQAFSKDGNRMEDGVFIFQKHGGDLDRAIFTLRPMFVYFDPERNVCVALNLTSGIIHLDESISNVVVDSRQEVK